MKTCRKCGSSERNKFGKCKPCRRLANAKYAACNQENIKAKSAAYYCANFAKIKLKTHNWYLKNSEQRKITRDKWFSENKERTKATNSAWNKKNHHKKISYTHKRRANKLQATPKWFGELDEFIMQEAVKLCILRKSATSIKWSIDHHVPLQGKLVCGLHIGCNIQVIPASINSSKRNYYWENMP